MNHLEESTKFAKDTRFAILGRAIADRATRGQDATALIAEATILRRQEQDSADRQTQFAALARQIGDAARNGQDTAPHVARLMELRASEVGPAHSS